MYGKHDSYLSDALIHERIITAKERYSTLFVFVIHVLRTAISMLSNIKTNFMYLEDCSVYIGDEASSGR